MIHLLPWLSIAVWLWGSIVLIVLLLRWLSRKLNDRMRLRIWLKNRAEAAHADLVDRFPPLKAFREAVEISGVPVSAELLLGFSAVLAAVSFFGAGEIVNELKLHYALDADRLVESRHSVLSAVFAVLMGAMPIFYVFFSLQRKRQNIALAMIPAVQNIIGHLNGNVSAGELVTRARRSMPGEIAGEWKRLELAIRTRSARDALYDFARRIGSHWAEDLADIMLVKAEFGHDVTKALHKLVRDMQTAKSNEQKRQAVISIYRIGTSFMVAAALFIIGFNIRADPNNYRYYFIEPKGRMLVTVTLIVLFASMIVVILSGRKRI